MPALSARFARQIRALAPADRVVATLEVRHPDVAAPIRVVNDSEDLTVGGVTYVALRFDARLADDVDGRAPRAELTMDNVGAALTQWIEASRGGAGATVRVALWAVGERRPDVQADLDVQQIEVSQDSVVARLGFDAGLDRAAVSRRYDTMTAPGLY